MGLEKTGEVSIAGKRTYTSAPKACSTSGPRSSTKSSSSCSLVESRSDLRSALTILFHAVAKARLVRGKSRGRGRGRGRV